MRCTAVEGVLADLSRDQDVREAERAAALAHALHCVRCADRFGAERRVSAGLAALAERTDREEAPAAVGERVLRAFGARQAARTAAPAPVMPPRRWMGLWMAAAAAAFVFVVWTDGRGLGRGRILEDATLSPPTPASSAAGVGEPSGFIPLTYGPPLTELDGAQVVRVQIQASALQLLGWAVAADSPAQTVDADVLVGADGVARALRIVASADEPRGEG